MASQSEGWTGTDALWNVWFTELHEGQIGLSIKVKRLLHSGQTPYQRLDILDTYQYGRMLVLYGSVMLTEKDEFFYHEMIVHPAMLVHAEPKRVLVVGGGDGGSLREVLKHRTVESATLVEIDQEVVERSKEFFSWAAPAFGDRRSRVVFEDAARFLVTDDATYDVIIVDSADPVGPATSLFDAGFYKSCSDRLSDSGAAVFQTLSPWYHAEKVDEVFRGLREVFPVVRMYLTFVPTYPSAIWSFAFCSKKLDPLANFDDESYARAGIETKYYNPGIHRGAFALPNFIEKMMKP